MAQRSDRAGRQGHRQADQICAADALSRRARARRFGLCTARRFSPRPATRGLIAERGKAGHGFRDRPLPAAVPRRRKHSRPDLADDHVSRPDVDLARQARGAHHAYRRAAIPRATSSPVVPDADVMFSGDLVEYHSACYCGDAHFTDWPATLDDIAEFNPQARWCRAAAPRSQRRRRSRDGIALTRRLSSPRSTARRESVGEGPLAQGDLSTPRARVMDPKFSSFAIYEHCLPFNVSRAYDEARASTIR